MNQYLWVVEAHDSILGEWVPTRFTAFSRWDARFELKTVRRSGMFKRFRLRKYVVDDGSRG